MKKFILALAAFLGLTIFTPTAEAGCRTSVIVDRCGYTVYSEYRFVGRDCHGCPVYDWVVVRRVPPCDHGHGYAGGGYSRGGYSGHSYAGHGGGYSRGGGGISFHWSR